MADEQKAPKGAAFSGYHQKTLEYRSVPNNPVFSRWGIARMLGLQFGGLRDLYETFGYPKDLTYDMMLTKYVRQDIAKRIVDEPVKAIWTDPPKIKVKDKELTEWNDLAKQFNIWNAIGRADRMLAFGEFSVLLLGMKGQAANPATRTGKLLYVQPYGARDVKICKWETRTGSARFGLPTEYEITTHANAEGSQSVSPPLKVHHSRIIHLTDPLLADNSRSLPRLQPVYNLLEDLLKVGGGSSEIYWLNGSRGLQVDVDKEMDLTPDDERALTDELEEFQHQLRRYIRTRGVEITPMQSDVPDPRGSFEVILSLLSAATGIPQRILMGAEAGQLASEQDRANWAVQVGYRRKEFAEPYILTPILTKLSSLGVIKGELTADQIHYEWPNAFKMSPLEDTQMMAQQARAIVNISRQAQYSHPIVTTEEAREIIKLPPVPETGEKLPSVSDAVAFAEEGQALKAPPEEGEDGEDEGVGTRKPAGTDPERNKSRQNEGPAAISALLRNQRFG